MALSSPIAHAFGGRTTRCCGGTNGRRARRPLAVGRALEASARRREDRRERMRSASGETLQEWRTVSSRSAAFAIVQVVTCESPGMGLAPRPPRSRLNKEVDNARYRTRACSLSTPRAARPTVGDGQGKTRSALVPGRRGRGGRAALSVRRFDEPRPVRELRRPLRHLAPEGGLQGGDGGADRSE